MSDRMDAIGQNGNDGYHYKIKVGDYVTFNYGDDDYVYKVIELTNSNRRGFDEPIAVVIDTDGSKDFFYLDHLSLANSNNNDYLKNKRSQILDKAKKIINGERQKSYGNPEDNFAKIASFWSDYLCEEISAKDVAMMMILLKVARMGTGAGTEDCLIDIAGYAALAAELD